MIVLIVVLTLIAILVTYKCMLLVFVDTILRQII